MARPISTRDDRRDAKRIACVSVLHRWWNVSLEPEAAREEHARGAVTAADTDVIATVGIAGIFSAREVALQGYFPKLEGGRKLCAAVDAGASR